MQYSSLFLAAIVATVVSAQTPLTLAPGATTMRMNASGIAAPTGSNASRTSSGIPVRQSIAAAPPALLAQAGGLVSVAGLGVAFAVFI